MQWTRVELKNYAKAFLRRHYWKAFIVCLIFTILTGANDSSSGSSEVEHSTTPGIESQYEIEEEGTNIRVRGTNTFIRFLDMFAVVRVLS